MEFSSVQKLARVLRVLVVIVFVCNLLALTAVPLLSIISFEEAVVWGVEGLGYLFGTQPVPKEYWPITFVYFFAWVGIWTELESAVMAVFLWVCGIGTAVILWQAKKVLENIVMGSLFSDVNGLHLKRAAVCSFVVSGTSLLWAVFRGVMNGILELLSLSTLFFPVFFLAGLLFLVMSALFCQAAELKAENDLTI
jgi:hypothetical protein